MVGWRVVQTIAKDHEGSEKCQTADTSLATALPPASQVRSNKTTDHLHRLLNRAIPRKLTRARQAILLEILPFFRRKIRHVPEASRTDFARVRDAVRRALALPQSEVAALGRRAIQFDNKLSKLECSCASF